MSLFLGRCIALFCGICFMIYLLFNGLSTAYSLFVALDEDGNLFSFISRIFLYLLLSAFGFWFGMHF